jgi:heme oxygenase (biliverdin-IX-beta and delta-forming)
MIAPAIKRLTASIHADAEAAVRTFAPFDSLDAYASYLGVLHGFYEAIEPALLERLAPIVDDAHARFGKRHAIAKDLERLGEAVIVPPVSVPRFASTAAALGVAYVLEGKTLGARFLLAEARETLALDVDCGATFLAGYGARTGPMWNGYRGALERWVSANGRRNAVLDGARATFASFIACVSSASSPSLRRRAAS